MFQRVNTTLLAGFVALVLILGPAAGAARAQTVIDLTKPDAFPTLASGLMPATKDDRNVAVARIELPSGAPVADPVAGLPGFVIAITGTVVISSGSTGTAAVLQVGDAFWLAEDETYTASALDGDAAIWRVAIGPKVNGRDISKIDPYTMTLGDLTSNPIADGAVRQYSVRAGLIPDGSDLRLGLDDESIVFAFSLSGTFTLLDSNRPVNEGELESPFFGMQPEVTTAGDPVYLGYIVQGPILDLSTPTT